MVGQLGVSLQKTPGFVVVGSLHSHQPWMEDYLLGM